MCPRQHEPTVICPWCGSSSCLKAEKPNSLTGFFIYLFFLTNQLPKLGQKKKTRSKLIEKSWYWPCGLHGIVSTANLAVGHIAGQS